METIIGDYIWTTIGIHSPIPTKHRQSLTRQQLVLHPAAARWEFPKIGDTNIVP